MLIVTAAGAGFLLFSHALCSTVHKSRLEPREIPQEHSHDVFLTITQEALIRYNPKNIQDAVFGLVGIQSAKFGAGSVKNLDCLKQEIADQAFTNGKAIKDLRLMAGALVYQALEINTIRVGLASAACTEEAVNPEVGAISQHQDPASPNATEINKAVTLQLAKQLKGIGADPNLALLSGTFAPGNPNDPTSKGNSCNNLDIELGCIFRSKKLVLDVSQAEVASAASPMSQTFTGTGGIRATDLVDLNSFSTKKVTPSSDAPGPSATNTDDTGLSTGAIVSIVVGGPIGVGILIIIGFVCRRRRNRALAKIQDHQPGEVYEKPGTTGGFEMDAIGTAVAELPAISVTQSRILEVYGGQKGVPSAITRGLPLRAPPFNPRRPLSYISGSVDQLDLDQRPGWI